MDFPPGNVFLGRLPVHELFAGSQLAEDESGSPTFQDHPRDRRARERRANRRLRGERGLSGYFSDPRVKSASPSCRPPGVSELCGRHHDAPMTRFCRNPPDRCIALVFN